MYSLCNYCYSETNYNEPTLKKIDTAMKKNMGSMDRLIRVIIAILLVSLYFTNVITGALGIVLISLVNNISFDQSHQFLPTLHPFWN